MKQMAEQKAYSDLYIDNELWNDLCAVQGHNPYELVVEMINEHTHNEKVWIELEVVKRWIKDNGKNKDD